MHDVHMKADGPPSCVVRDANSPFTACVLPLFSAPHSANAPSSQTNARPPTGHHTRPSAHAYHPHNRVHYLTRYWASLFPAMPTEHVAHAHSRQKSSIHHTRYTLRVSSARCSNKSGSPLSYFDISQTIPGCVILGSTIKSPHT